MMDDEGNLKFIDLGLTVDVNEIVHEIISDVNHMPP